MTNMSLKHCDGTETTLSPEERVMAELDNKLTEALMLTFPASDPIAVSNTSPRSAPSRECGHPSAEPSAVRAG